MFLLFTIVFNLLFPLLCGIYNVCVHLIDYETYGYHARGYPIFAHYKFLPAIISVGWLCKLKRWEKHYCHLKFYSSVSYRVGLPFSISVLCLSLLDMGFNSQDIYPAKWDKVYCPFMSCRHT